MRAILLGRPGSARGCGQSRRRRARGAQDLSTIETMRTRSIRTSASRSARAGILPQPPCSRASPSRSSPECRVRRTPNGSFATRGSAIGCGRIARVRVRTSRRRTSSRAPSETTRLGAQQRLRAAFLGDAPIATAVSDLVDPKLAGWAIAGRCLSGSATARTTRVETRSSPSSSSSPDACSSAGLLPILLGDALRQRGRPRRVPST